MVTRKFTSLSDPSRLTSTEGEEVGEGEGEGEGRRSREE
jgi:hypothetical protein